MLKRQQGTAFLFLLIFLAPVLLWSYLKTEQYMIRHAMEEQLEQQHLDTLRIAEKDLVWYKKGKEVLIGQRLFDVKQLTREGQTVVLTGLFDENETRVKNKMSQLAKQQQQDDRSSQQILNKLIHADWIQPIYRATIQADESGLEKRKYLSFTPSLLTLTLTLPLPPPKA